MTAATQRPFSGGGLFITGTDTHVGKTWIASGIVSLLHAQGLRVGAYKPVASGCERTATGELFSEDVDKLARALGDPSRHEWICPQRFAAPVAPPVAARLEGKTVDADLLTAGARRWESVADLLIVEGAGGLLCPVTDTLSIADLAAAFGFPLVIVARTALGTINHTLLTVEVAQRRGLPIAGIVLNQPPNVPDDPSTATNAAEIAARCSVPILAIVPALAEDGLLQHPPFVRLDWRALAHRR